MSLRLRALLFVVVLSLAPLQGIASVYAHAKTPEEAAIRTVYAAPGKRVTVVRVNRAGRYATVLLHGAVIENQAFNDPILVEHFTFGWQAIENVNLGCSLDGHGLKRAEATALMRGMPAASVEKICDAEADIGPPAQVESVRRIQGANAFHPYVAVVGGYALADWYGGGGGEHLYAARHGRWVRIGGGGGAMGVEGLRALGVPRWASCILAGHGNPPPSCGKS